MATQLIDLRSDTFTEPDDQMRAVMMAARVGDDVYAEDPTVEELQIRVASMFGKQAGLFVPSGTQGNQICIALHASPGDEIIAEHDAHIFHYENAATSVIARAQIRTIASETGAMNPDDVRAAIRPSAYYYPRTSLITVEQTHLRHGGTITPLENLKALKSIASEHGIAMHCDGARIWNAITATGVSASTYGSIFDTLSVCLSKGLGAPVGSVILGTHEHINKARRWRKMLGGGMRQVGFLAAAGLYGLDNILPKLANDHANAMQFATLIASHDKIEVSINKVESNIVAFRVPSMTDEEFVSACHINGLRIAPIRAGVMRAVFYHQISEDDAQTAAEIIASILNSR